jgi:iron complex outermembrane receptor protein
MPMARAARNRPSDAKHLEAGCLMDCGRLIGSQRLFQDSAATRAAVRERRESNPLQIPPHEVGIASQFPEKSDPRDSGGMSIFLWGPLLLPLTPARNAPVTKSRFSGWGVLMRLSVGVALCGLCSLSFATDPAHASIRKDTNIPTEELGSALQTLAKDYDFQVLYRTEIVKDLKTRGAVGSLTADEALTQVLSGTGLIYKYLDGQTVTIVPTALAATATTADQTNPPTSTDTTKEGKKSSSDGFRVAQVGQGQTASSSAVEKSPEKSEKKKEKDVQEAYVRIPEILVTGSKLLDMDIQRTPDDPQPYVVFDREQITQSGAASLEDFLKNRLTMNTVAGTNAQNVQSTNGNQSQINLRGLGTNQTLILIDGHRTSSVNSQGAPQQFDINGIPLAAVERVEILPTTASAIYGGGATGGVVNIILRRDYSGAEVRLTYGSPFSSNAGLGTANLSAGLNLEEGKTNILVAGSYSDGRGLTVGDRDFLQNGRAAILGHNGNNYQVFSAGNGSPPLGATPNILSADGSNLVLNNGTALNSPITYVPVGYSGTSDGGAALVANAGKYNLGLANSAQVISGSRSSLVQTPQLESMTTTLRRQFSPSVQVFLEASVSSNSADVTQGLAVANSSPFLLPAGSPTNPFQQAILVSVPTNSDTMTASSTNNGRRLIGGVIVKLPREWMSEADYTWDQSRFSFHEGPTSLTSAAAPAITAGTLNILRDTNAYPVDFSPYLDPTSSLRFGEPFRATLKDASLRFAGPIDVPLPAGAPQVATLLEHRDENLSDGIFGDGAFTALFPARSQSVDSVYAEIRLPLVSKKNAVPAIQELELQISVRHDDYTTHGVTGVLCCDPGTIAAAPIARTTNKIRSTDPLVALRYQPVEDLALRASYGTGFLPPSVDQIVPNPVNFFGPCTAVDSLRGNTIVSFSCVQGGNPNLRPEQSKSWSAGAIVTPRVLPGLRISVDYTNIRKTDNITSLDLSQGLTALEALGRVTRGPNLPGDPPGFAGPITFIDDTLVNLLKAKVEAYDVQLDYRLNTVGAGVLDLFALATWETHYKTEVLAGSPPVENVGVGDFNPLKLKANAGATWTRRQWILGWSARYFDSYWVNAAHTFDVNQGSDHVPSQIYHDIFATYRFDVGTTSGSWSDHLFSDTEITLGVKNLFNKKPPFDANNTNFFYSNFGDPRLASYWLSIRKSFNH